MTFSDRELEEMRPISARCTDDRLIAILKDLREISIPLWWYPRQHNANPGQRANIELEEAA